MLTLKGLKNYITINEKLKMSKKNPTVNLGMRNVYNSKKKEHNLQHCEGRPYDLGDVKGLTFSNLPLLLL